MEGDMDQLKLVQRALKVKLRESKDAYSRKLDNQLQYNMKCVVWSEKDHRLQRERKPG